MEEIADKKAALKRPVVGKIYKRKQEMKKPGRIAGNKKKKAEGGKVDRRKVKRTSTANTGKREKRHELQ